MFQSINVNDPVTKTKFDNKHGVRHKIIDGLNRALDTLIGGKVCLVADYGDFSKGAAETLRAQGQELSSRGLIRFAPCTQPWMDTRLPELNPLLVQWISLTP